MAANDRFPPTGALLIVSPHQDDAALSCAALLARQEAVHVVTVFTGQPEQPWQGEWDRLTGFANSSDSAASRRDEEARAFAASSHAVSNLGLLDLQYIVPPRQRSDADAVAGSIIAWCEDKTRPVVALPCAAGARPGRVRQRLSAAVGGPRCLSFHPDHQFVRDAGLDAAQRRPDLAVLLYEELPYRFGARAQRTVTAVCAERHLTSTPIVAKVDRRVKAQRIAAYASQLPYIYTRRLDDPDELPDDECYWWLATTAPRREAVDQTRGLKRRSPLRNPGTKPSQSLGLGSSERGH